MGMESVYKLSVVLNMVDQLTAPMGRASQNLGSRLSGLQSGFCLLYTSDAADE